MGHLHAGLESTSEPIALFVLADRTSDSGRGQYGATLHSSAALRSDKCYEGSDDDGLEPICVSSPYVEAASCSHLVDQF